MQFLLFDFNELKTQDLLSNNFEFNQNHKSQEQIFENLCKSHIIIDGLTIIQKIFIVHSYLKYTYAKYSGKRYQTHA